MPKAPKPSPKRKPAVPPAPKLNTPKSRYEFYKAKHLKKPPPRPTAPAGSGEPQPNP